MKWYHILLLFLIISTPITAYARVPTSITDINEDGYVEFDGTYDLYNLVYLQADIVGDPTHWYIEFNITELQANITIDQVNLWVTGSQAGQHNIREFNSTKQPSTMADNNGNNQIIYTDAGNGTVYYTLPTSVLNTTYKIDLGATAVRNLQEAIDNSRTYFVIGASGGGASNARTWSEEVEKPAYRPILVIKYHLPTDYTYIFSDTYYENGTLCVPPINVTATGPGFIESFNTSGGTTQYYPVEPELFYWGITDGVTTTSRRIYSIGEENFTVTYPESTFDTFVFTVRDFTGKLSRGDAYLESWRIINATDTLIERQKIDIHNEVPLNLVIGATYSIRVRFYDGSLLTWGTFVPGDTATFTIVPQVNSDPS